MGLLSKGDVVVKNPSDFIGSVLGESEKKTAAILEATVGCVLVIDEAYGLHHASHNGKGGSDIYKVSSFLSCHKQDCLRWCKDLVQLPLIPGLQSCTLHYCCSFVKEPGL